MPEFQMPFEGIADRKAFNELDEFTKGYVEAIFFTECHGDNPEMEKMTYADVPVQVRARIVAECIAFQHDNAASLADATDDSRKDPYDMRRAGHDFWFTRNGHGVGYWDRELGDVGDALDKAAKKAGGRDAYAGDDGNPYDAYLPPDPDDPEGFVRPETGEAP